MKKTVGPAHEIGENVTITERSQLMSITPEQAKKIKSLRFENQVIDQEAYNAITDLYAAPERLYFVDCSFSESGEWILCEFPSVSKVGFIHCNLSYDDLKELLGSSNSDNNFEVLDLTGNDLSKDPNQFVKLLFRTIVQFTLFNRM